MLRKVVPIVDCEIRPLSTQVLHVQMSWSKFHRHRFGGIELLHSSMYVVLCMALCVVVCLFQLQCFLHGR